MAKRKPPLGVWLYGMRIAEITPKGRGYDLTMHYTADACDRWPGNSPILSCSLPLGRSPLNPTEYFRGLLPEGQHLQYLASQAKVATSDLYSLLARYGRDVTGATVVSDNEPEERAGAAIPYDGEDLADEVAGLGDRPLALYDDSELSIPGLQDKLLLIKTDTGWARPAGGRPSTHILKVEDRRFPGLVSMEHAAMTIARRLGLTTVETEIVNLGGIDCIIVSRYDRRVDATGQLQRIHQEDICQALGINPQANQGKAKYESCGGPGLAQVARLLDQHARAPERELTRLVQVVAFTSLIGNSDAHAKNLSLLHTEPGVIELAPLYDTVPTVLWTKLPDRAAMHVNSVTILSQVTLGDVVSEATRWPLDPAIAERSAVDVARCVLDALNSVPKDLADVITERAEKFLHS
ncbi:MAG: HipA domain-containing protein [Actinomycetota bacterium]|nr:HipA domain-containing protein [Actinomycetota bacterium]